MVLKKYGNDTEFDTKLSKVLGVIRNIGAIVSIGALMVIGIKEMTASVEEKTILKQALPGYILGAIMVMAITVIPSLIYDAIHPINN